MLREWQDKCDDLTDQVQHADEQMKEAIQNDRQSRENLRKMKQEKRLLEASLTEKETEI